MRTCGLPGLVSEQPASQEMLDLLQALRKKVVIGFVGGSNLVKQIEQLSVRGHDSMWDIRLLHGLPLTMFVPSTLCTLSTARGFSTITSALCSLPGLRLLLR